MTMMLVLVVVEVVVGYYPIAGGYSAISKLRRRRASDFSW